MNKIKKNMVENIALIMSGLFIVAVSLYHISFEGFMGLTKKAWYCIWDLSETGLLLAMCLIITSSCTGFVKMLFGWPVMFYLIFRTFYYLSCHSGIYVMTTNNWSLIILAPLIAGLIFITFRKWQK